MATKPTSYKVLVGRVEARVGKKEIAAEAGETINLGEEAAAKLIARGIVEQVTTAEAKTSAPVAPKVEVVDQAKGPAATVTPAVGAGGGAPTPAEGTAPAASGGAPAAGAAK